LSSWRLVGVSTFPAWRCSPGTFGRLAVQFRLHKLCVLLAQLVPQRIASRFPRARRTRAIRTPSRLIVSPFSILRIGLVRASAGRTLPLPWLRGRAALRRDFHPHDPPMEVGDLAPHRVGAAGPFRRLLLPFPRLDRAILGGILPLLPGRQKRERSNGDCSDDSCCDSSCRDRHVSNSFEGVKINSRTFQ
jgi:hypothetical protein